MEWINEMNWCYACHLANFQFNVTCASCYSPKHVLFFFFFTIFELFLLFYFLFTCFSFSLFNMAWLFTFIKQAIAIFLHMAFHALTSSEGLNGVSKGIWCLGLSVWDEGFRNERLYHLHHTKCIKSQPRMQTSSRDYS